MKHLSIIALIALTLTGCNTMTAAADRVMNKQSSFSQETNTRYPTADEQKNGDLASIAKQSFE